MTSDDLAARGGNSDGIAPATGGGTPMTCNPSGVVAAPWEGDDWALVVGSGSDLAELYEQAARLPAGLAFVEAFGDVDLVLVYRPADAGPARHLLGSLVDRAVAHGGTLVGPVGPDGLSAADRFESPAERAAFLAGQADALATMRRALTGTDGLPSADQRVSATP
jgi:uncharacterized repeat protein (TIGR03917 family)